MDLYNFDGRSYLSYGLSLLVKHLVFSLLRNAGDGRIFLRISEVERYVNGCSLS